PIWAYHLSPLVLAIVMISVIELVAITGLVITRWLVVPRLHFHEGVNEGISGTVQAIGVFYGITVGLISVGVWNTYDASSDLVSKEAASIGVLYRDIQGYPDPLRTDLQAKLREYTVAIIDQVWPAQVAGKPINVGRSLLDDLQQHLYTFEPANSRQSALHNETLGAFNNLIEARRFRMGAVEAGLSSVMWSVIWIGAAISIGVAYLYRIEDLKLHIILISLMAGFLGLLIFMIVINDRPFFGDSSISSEPYKLVLRTAID
ncbi:MAG TPA: hypothetical protein VLB68_01615, partial [Pyrinomonadaceae bacterium]|nr:hypothetical protein [Pyrinomonadaceae bacterium]